MTDLPCSVASEELMTGADLPSSIFYGGTQYRNGVTKGLITKADLPQGRKKGFLYYPFGGKPPKAREPLLWTDRPTNRLTDRSQRN